MATAAGYSCSMAVLNVLVERTPREVWDVLSDGWSYAEWVAGTRFIREVDENWPEVGSKIYFTVGFGPFKIEDFTEVQLLEPCQRLELEVHAGRLGTARNSIGLVPWGEDRTIVVLDEHPLRGPGGRLHNVLIELLLRIRNRRMVRLLARLVERRHPR